MNPERIRINTMLFFSLLIVLLFESCEKNDNDDSPDIQCLVSKLIVMEEADDILEVVYFSYDNKNRLVRWEYDDGEYLEFVYNTNGKLEEVLEDNGTTRYHFTWESNKVTKQRDNWKEIITINSNNEINRVEYYYKDDNVWEIVAYDVCSWQNGNLVKHEEYWSDDWRKSLDLENSRLSAKSLNPERNLTPIKTSIQNQRLKSNSSNLKLKSTTTYTYDNKHNPLSIHQVLGLMSMFPLWHSRNNVITAQWETNSETYVGSYQWEYNNQNYPKKLVMIEYEGDYDDVVKIDFDYKNCD